MDFIIIENSGASKEIIKKVKRSSTESEKVFSKCISDRGLVPRIYKESLKFNNKKIT